MTKQILSLAVITTLAFVGCSQVSDTVSSAAKGTVDMAKSATKKVSSAVSNAVDSNKTAVDNNKTTVTSKVNSTVEKMDTKVTSMKVDAPESTLKVGDVVETKIDDASASSVPTLPTSSSMTDMAKGRALEVADDKTDGTASKVLDAVK